MSDAVIARIADAIAFAEGYFVPGSRPHGNPGDLERDLTGNGVGRDGPYVTMPPPKMAAKHWSTRSD